VSSQCSPSAVDNGTELITMLFCRMYQVAAPGAKLLSAIADNFQMDCFVVGGKCRVIDGKGIREGSSPSVVVT